MLGRHHPRVRELRSLRRDGGRRRERALFLAEGLHLAQEALAAGAPVVEAIFTDELTASPDGRALLDRMQGAGIPSESTAPETMAGLQDARAPQPLLLVISMPADAGGPLPLAPAAAGAAPIVVLDGIQDPGNLGALIRTADAAACAGVVLTGACADPYHPRTVRATTGSIFRMPIGHGRLDDELLRLRDHGYRVWGTAPRGGVAPERMPVSPTPALVFGGEGPGLQPAFLDGLDGTVSISMREGVESLSVAASAAVLLFDLRRRGLSRSDPPAG